MDTPGLDSRLATLRNELSILEAALIEYAGSTEYFAAIWNGYTQRNDEYLAVLKQKIRLTVYKGD